MKNQKSIRKTLTIVVVVEIVCVLAFAGYKVFSLTRTTMNLNRETQTLQQKIELAATYNDLETELSKTNADIATFKNTFFDDDTLLLFLRNLSDNALKFGVYINSVSFGGLTPAADSTPPILTLPVSLTVACDSKGLSNFLTYLETYKNYIVEDSVSFSTTAKSGTSINMKLYVQTSSSEKWSYMGGEP
jgi:Tfp pilus assembly protein PilO